ncbi:DEAD-domain-containing protein [Meira miltonrushii]|uniref:ATP-dependent RNA helicase n=1 Tax=Meira miltonrushii TaxID=1280837 RepID=A0A316VK81_9BASI|nr:DEAD-domain-containing protein [Meira miltonrushii]PWN37992.1 DEAD-domain-containing protein [Meira miltonrushii]
MDDGQGPSSLAYAPSYAGRWSKLKPGLEKELEEHLTDILGFEEMTPVQSNVIPLFLSHKDVIVEAVTGSGKTLAYVLPVLQMIMKRQDRLKKNQLGALVVCPTRELAVQVHGIIQSFLLTSDEKGEEQQGDSEPSNTIAAKVSGALLAVGGSTSNPGDDYKKFKEQGSDIVVGTPGRVLELLERTSIDCKELEVLILDEADRLLDMGFTQTLTSILRLLPKQRRTGLFSATMTDAMNELVRVGLRNPVRVVVKVETKTTARDSKMMNGSTSVNDKRTPASLDNHFMSMRAEHKLLQLIRILRAESKRKEDDLPMRKAIVFFATCAQVNFFYKVLSPLTQMEGLKLYSLHGKQTPVRRRATFDAFVSATPLGSASSVESSSVLLCTDVAARGLDLPNVDLVVQFDPPTDPKVFSHRCGRTARAGRRGRAIVLLNKGREEEYVDFLKVRKNPVKRYDYLCDGNGEASREEPQEVDSGALQLHNDIRKLIRNDRALYDFSMQAFVSFIQCFRKHEVSFVFRERDLDYGAIAFTFGLLRLPRMPEIDRWRKSKEAESTEGEKTLLFVEENVDLQALAFADKAREKQRQEGLEAKMTAQIANGKDSKPKKTIEEAWSEQKARKDRKQDRRDKKQRKRAFLAKQASEQGQEPVNGQAEETHEDDDDMNDWAEEERLAKKQKKDQSNKEDAADTFQFDDL